MAITTSLVSRLPGLGFSLRAGGAFYRHWRGAFHSCSFYFFCTLHSAFFIFFIFDRQPRRREGQTCPDRPPSPAGPQHSRCRTSIGPIRPSLQRQHLFAQPDERRWRTGPERTYPDDIHSLRSPRTQPHSASRLVRSHCGWSACCRALTRPPARQCHIVRLALYQLRLRCPPPALAAVLVRACTHSTTTHQHQHHHHHHHHQQHHHHSPHHHHQPDRPTNHTQEISASDSPRPRPPLPRPGSVGSGGAYALLPPPPLPCLLSPFVVSRFRGRRTSMLLPLNLQYI